MAFLAVPAGQIDLAEKTAEEAVAIFEELQNPFGLSVASAIVLGVVFMEQGKFGQAKDAYQKGLHAARSIDYRRILQLAYDSLGSIALAETHLDDAYSYFLKSLKITFESGQTREQLGSVRDIATVYKLEGKLEKALELLAVVLHHPASVQNSLSRRESLKDEAEHLRSEIEKAVSSDRYNTAWKSGQSLELGDVVAKLLKENQDAPTIDADITANRQHRTTTG